MHTNIFPNHLPEQMWFSFFKISFCMNLTPDCISCPLFSDKPNKRVTGDPDKTLFVGKLSKDTSEGWVFFLGQIPLVEARWSGG